MSGKFSRDKGSRFERDLAKILTAGGFPASRNARNGLSTDDIAHQIPGLHIEAKHCEKIMIPKWWEQAVKDAEGRRPAIVFKQNHKSPRVVIELDYFLELLRCTHGI